MIDPVSFVFFLGASALALAIPGPTIALVIARALSDGRRVSVPLALGIGAGTLVGSTAAIAGAGAVLMASATAFVIAKWIGAAYLVYLGIKLFLAQPGLAQEDGVSERSSAVLGLRDGFFVTLLNPKSLAFSAAFIPQFIGPGGGYVGQAAVLVVSFSVLAMVNALVFAFGADALRRFVRNLAVLRWVNRIGASVLIASGVAGVFLKRSALS